MASEGVAWARWGSVNEGRGALKVDVTSSPTMFRKLNKTHFGRINAL